MDVQHANEFQLVDKGQVRGRFSIGKATDAGPYLELKAHGQLWRLRLTPQGPQVEGGDGSQLIGGNITAQQIAEMIGHAVDRAVGQRIEAAIAECETKTSKVGAQLQKQVEQAITDVEQRLVRQQQQHSAQLTDSLKAAVDQLQQQMQQAKQQLTAQAQANLQRTRNSLAAAVAKALRETNKADVAELIRKALNPE